MYVRVCVYVYVCASVMDYVSLTIATEFGRAFSHVVQGGIGLPRTTSTAATTTTTTIELDVELFGAVTGLWWRDLDWEGAFYRRRSRQAAAAELGLGLSYVGA